MAKLLLAEWIKLKHYRAFWVCLILYTLSLPALIMGLHTFNIQLGGGTSIGFSFYHFPVVWHNITFIASWFNLLLYFFFILLITNEFQFRTLRQHIIEGISREEVLLSKGLLALLFSTFSTVLVTAVGWFCGTYLSNQPILEAGLITQKISFLAAFWLQTFAYLSLSVFLSLLIRSQGLTILCFLGYSLLLEKILYFRILPPPLAAYLPIENFSQLIPGILNNLIDQPGPNGPSLQHIGTSSLYIFLLWLAAWGWLKRRDL